MASGPRSAANAAVFDDVEGWPALTLPDPVRRLSTAGGYSRNGGPGDHEQLAEDRGPGGRFITARRGPIGG